VRITHEADYAVRIIYTLMRHGETVSARQISEESGVTLRFALKILRKLAAEGIVTSSKGASGGYALAIPAEELSLGRVISCIDGPFELNHCLENGFECTRVEDKESCPFHNVFCSLSERLGKELDSIKMAQFR